MGSSFCEFTLVSPRTGPARSPGGSAYEVLVWIDSRGIPALVLVGRFESVELEGSRSQQPALNNSCQMSRLSAGCQCSRFHLCRLYTFIVLLLSLYEVTISCCFSASRSARFAGVLEILGLSLPTDASMEYLPPSELRMRKS